jgi:serine/threonine-protein kinase Chk1
MFEALHVSFDADPFAGTQPSGRVDAMEIDRPVAKLASTQPDVPTEDMLFDWERPRHLAVSSTQVGAGLVDLVATQSVFASNFLADEPSMSQFAATPSVPLTRTQMARKFRDILPAQSLTKFYSGWTLNLLVPHVLEALSRLGVPTPHLPRPTSALDRECVIKVKTQDSRGCPMSGNIAMELIGEAVVEVCFVKASGDPLEWRRLFKRMAVLCQDAVFKPEE